MVFFKREALDDFCRAMLDVMQMPQQEQWQAFKAGQYLIEQVEPGGNLLCWFYVLCWFETFGVVFALYVAVMQCRLGSCLGPVQRAKHGMACGIVAWRSQRTGQGMCVKNALPQSRCARGLYVWQLLLLMLPLLRLLACLAVSSCSLVSPYPCRMSGRTCLTSRHSAALSAPTSPTPSSVAPPRASIGPYVLDSSTCWVSEHLSSPSPRTHHRLTTTAAGWQSLSSGGSLGAAVPLGAMAAIARASCAAC